MVLILKKVHQVTTVRLKPEICPIGGVLTLELCPQVGEPTQSYAPELVSWPRVMRVGEPRPSQVHKLVSLDPEIMPLSW